MREYESMINIYIQNKQYNTQIQYVFNTIFFVLGNKCIYKDTLSGVWDSNDACIIYCSSELKTLNIPDKKCNLLYIKDSGKLFGDEYLKPESIPCRVNKYDLDNLTEEINDIISIYNDGKQLYINTDKEKNVIITNIDIISDVFFMLTRYEEVVTTEATKKDKHDRFPAWESLAYRNSFLHRPIVNEHIELFWSWIESFTSGYRRMNWWGENGFAVCLSHDVDHIIKNRHLFDACKHALAIILKRKKLIKAIKYMKDYFLNIRDYTKDPYWTFNKIIDIEKKNDFYSSFYFMASDNSDPDFRYDVSDQKAEKLINELEVYGCEIGYHGSLSSYNNERIMNIEKKRLDSMVSKKPYGCRQHYLKFKVPFTWRYQFQSGILYDTTMSFADHEGFRCGICFPFKPYDILDDKVLDIWEIPLLIMEGTLQSPIYRNLTPEEGLKSIFSIIETVKRYNGVFTILWHNSSFDYNWDGWNYVFEETINYLGESNCIGLTGREIIENIIKKCDWRLF